MELQIPIVFVCYNPYHPEFVHIVQLYEEDFEEHQKQFNITKVLAKVAANTFIPPVKLNHHAWFMRHLTPAILKHKRGRPFEGIQLDPWNT